MGSEMCIRDRADAREASPTTPSLSTSNTILRYIGDPLGEWSPQQLVALSFTRNITAALEMDHDDGEERSSGGDRSMSEAGTIRRSRTNGSKEIADLFHVEESS